MPWLRYPLRAKARETPGQLPSAPGHVAHTHSRHTAVGIEIHGHGQQQPSVRLPAIIGTVGLAAPSGLSSGSHGHDLQRHCRHLDGTGFGVSTGATTVGGVGVFNIQKKTGFTKVVGLIPAMQVITRDLTAAKEILGFVAKGVFPGAVAGDEGSGL